MNQAKELWEKHRFLQHIAALPFVERIILYGSRARGDHHDRSDIDIAVDCPGASKEDWRTIRAIAEYATLLPVDCVRYDTLTPDNDLKKSIDEEGVVMFERSKIESH